MQNKSTILIVVIVLAFGIAAILIGRSFLTGGGMGNADVGTASTGQVILPHGNTLDFSKIEQFNKNKRTFVYPEVTPMDIGLGLGQIVR